MHKVGARTPSWDLEHDMTYPRSPLLVRGPHNRTATGCRTLEKVSAAPTTARHRRRRRIRAGRRALGSGLFARWCLTSRQSANNPSADPETSHKPADQPASRPTTCQWSNNPPAPSPESAQPPPTQAKPTTQRGENRPQRGKPTPGSRWRTERQAVVAAPITSAGNPTPGTSATSQVLPVARYTHPRKTPPRPGSDLSAGSA